MGVFSGQLGTNEIYAALFNMILSQQVFADDIKGTFSKLVEDATEEAGLYGDRKLYYATDALEVADWNGDAEAANLLALSRPADPKVQEIVIDQFKIISLTLDDYLSKRAWGTEGAFSQFNSRMLGWLGDTKRIHMSKTYNAFIGTSVSGEAAQNITVSEGSSWGQSIAQAIADLMIELQDASPEFNDDGVLRSYDEGEIKIVWNASVVNEIKKIDLPALFHKEGLEIKMDEYVIPAKYFGAVSALTTSTSGVRALIEMDAVKGAVTTHYRPGDVVETGSTVAANSTYVPDADIICKVLVKLPPVLSAFSTGTNFFNPRSLTSTSYLIFGYNTLEYLTSFPMITLSK